VQASVGATVECSFHLIPRLFLTAGAHGVCPLCGRTCGAADSLMRCSRPHVCMTSARSTSTAASALRQRGRTAPHRLTSSSTYGFFQQVSDMFFSCCRRTRKIWPRTTSCSLAIRFMRLLWIWTRTSRRLNMIKLSECLKHALFIIHIQDCLQWLNYLA
jgi:hypothetical protein